MHTTAYFVAEKSQYSFFNCSTHNLQYRHDSHGSHSDQRKSLALAIYIRMSCIPHSRLQLNINRPVYIKI